MVETLGQYKLAVNKELAGLYGAKYEGMDELRRMVNESIEKVEQPLGELLRVNYSNINLIKEEHIEFGGEFGEEIFSIKVITKDDKRCAYKAKGSIQNVYIEISADVTELMKFADIIEHFNKIDYKQSIEWYDVSIKKAEERVLKLLKEKQEYIRANYKTEYFKEDIK